jgi:hypothetical protein
MKKDDEQKRFEGEGDRQPYHWEHPRQGESAGRERRRNQTFSFLSTATENTIDY